MTSRACFVATVLVAVLSEATANYDRADQSGAQPVRSRTVSLQPSPGAPTLHVQRAFDGGGEDQAYDIWPAPGGGYVITGSTEDPRTEDVDLLVLRLDDAGELVWARTFGGPRLEIGFAVRTLGDGSIVVAGWTHSTGAGAGDVYVLGLSGDGEVRFERTFGGAGEERATALTATRDGGVAILGESYSHGAGDARFYLVKLDAGGQMEWERTYDGGPLHERGLAILENDDGYLLVGNSMDSRSGSTATVSDGYAVRTNQQGDEVWSRRYGGDAHDIFHHAAPLGPDRYLLTGYTRGFGARGENDIWLVTVDGAGETVRSRLLGGEGADHNIIARASGDGAVYLAGYTRSRGAGGWDAQVIRVDGTADVVWDHVFGGTGDDGAVSLVPLDGGGLAVAGYTRAQVGAASDILFLVLGEGGNRAGGAERRKE